DSGILPGVLSHLYRDYGEICYQTGDLAGSQASLERTMELDAKTPGTPDSALTYAILAQVETLQGRYDAADLSLQQATMRIRPFRADYPMAVAQISIIGGYCYTGAKRWSAARQMFLQAVDVLTPI